MERPTPSDQPEAAVLVSEAAQLIRTSPDLTPAEVDAMFDAAEAAKVPREVLGQLIAAITDYYDPPKIPDCVEADRPSTPTPLDMARRVLPKPPVKPKAGSLSELERATELIYPEDFEAQVVAIVEKQKGAFIFELTRLIFNLYLPSKMVDDVRKRLLEMVDQGQILEPGRGYYIPVSSE